MQTGLCFVLSVHAASCSMLKWESKNGAKLQVFVVFLMISFLQLCILMPSISSAVWFFLELIRFVF